MSMHFSTNSFKPTLWSLSERTEEIILGDDLDFSSDYLAIAVNAAYRGLLPNFFAIETPACDWEILSGNKTLYALREYILNNVSYPENGGIIDLQGKRFLELPRATQRRLGNTTVLLNIFVCFSGNNGKEDAFRQFVKDTSTLI